MIPSARGVVARGKGATSAGEREGPKRWGGYQKSTKEAVRRRQLKEHEKRGKGNEAGTESSAVSIRGGTNNWGPSGHRFVTGFPWH